MTKSFQVHKVKLAVRIALLVVAFALWLRDPALLDATDSTAQWWFLAPVWAVLAGGMLLRLIPNRTTPIGARKQSASSYRQGQAAGKQEGLHRGAAATAIIWVGFHVGFFPILRLLGLLTPGALLVLTLIYAVCDIVCILFFCPFQRFLMHNRCCTVCRIYNWDYLMMCTPLILYPSAYALSLFFLAAALVVVWEWALFRHPEYFSDKTNAALRCDCCEDKCCHLRGKGSAR